MGLLSGDVNLWHTLTVTSYGESDPVARGDPSQRVKTLYLQLSTTARSRYPYHILLSAEAPLSSRWHRR